MYIILGAICGCLGFIPLPLFMHRARMRPESSALEHGMAGLAGVFVSLVILASSLILCGIMARSGVVPFAASEALVFLGCTIVFVLRKNAPFKNR